MPTEGDTNTEEKAPSLNVIVEGDGGADERLSADLRDDRDETPEERTQRNRREKDERKNRRRDYEREERALVASLQADNQGLRTRLERLEGHTIKAEAEKVEREAVYWERQVRGLRAARDRAAAAENVQAALAASDELRVAEQNYDRLMHIREQPVQPPGGQDGDAPDPVVAQFAQTFHARNPWYGKPGYEKETRIARRLEKELRDEGSDPRAEDFWFDIEERLKEKVDVPVGDDDDSDDRDAGSSRRDNGDGRGRASRADDSRRDRGSDRGRDRDADRGRGERRGPPLGDRGGGDRAPGRGAREVHITAAEREKYIQAGVWDDPKARDKVLRERERIREEQRKGIRR
jgi:hypothetical protein